MIRHLQPTNPCLLLLLTLLGGCAAETGDLRASVTACTYEDLDNWNRCEALPAQCDLIDVMTYEYEASPETSDPTASMEALERLWAPTADAPAGLEGLDRGEFLRLVDLLGAHASREAPAGSPVGVCKALGEELPGYIDCHAIYSMYEYYRGLTCLARNNVELCEGPFPELCSPDELDELRELEAELIELLQELRDDSIAAGCPSLPRRLYCPRGPRR